MFQDPPLSAPIHPRICPPSWFFRHGRRPGRRFRAGSCFRRVFSDSVGWKWGFRATSILNIVVLAIALWSLPASVDDDAPLGRATLTRLQKELDWFGALVISMSLAFLSYALAAVGAFNMVSQIGKSVGIATTAIITQQVPSPLMVSSDSKEALLRGYQAGWFYNCALSFISVFVSLGFEKRRKTWCQA